VTFAAFGLFARFGHGVLAFTVVSRVWRTSGLLRIGRTSNILETCVWGESGGGQARRSCSTAKRVAAARLEAPTFASMCSMCARTVLSLIEDGEKRVLHAH